MGTDGWVSRVQTPGGEDGRARWEGVILRPGASFDLEGAAPIFVHSQGTRV